MAGPWEQYQKPSAKPWEQYKAAPTSSFGPTGVGETPGGVPPEGPGKLERIWQGMLDPAVGIGQLATKAGAAQTGMEAAIGGAGTSEKLPAQMTAAPGQLDAAIGQRETRLEGGKLGTDWYRLLGNVASPVNLAMGAPLGAASKAAGLGGRLALGALGGAAGGAAEPVTKGDFWTEKEKQAGIGAAVGGGLGAAGSAMGRLVSPRLSPDAQKLAAGGVQQMTPAQMSPGPGGVTKGFEDRFQGFPILGDFIRNARLRSIDSFNQATINQALEPIGAKLPAKTGAGTDAVKTAGNMISKHYDDTLGRVPQVVSDPDLTTAITTIQTNAQKNPDVWRKLEPILNEDVIEPFQKGPLTGRQVQRVTSELNRLSRGYARSEEFDNRELGRNLDDIRGALMDTIERQHPAEADNLRNANASWAMLTRIEQAAGRTKSSEGIFSPNDLLQSVASQAGGVRRREFARGDALFQDWATLGNRVLPSKVPDSGTAGRLWAAHPLSSGAYTALTAPSWPFYTRPMTQVPGAGRQAIGAGIGGVAGGAAPVAGEEADRVKMRKVDPVQP